jgi:hypothetical protein
MFEEPDGDKLNVPPLGLVTHNPPPLTVLMQLVI